MGKTREREKTEGGVYIDSFRVIRPAPFVLSSVHARIDRLEERRSWSRDEISPKRREAREGEGERGTTDTRN